MKVKPAGRGRKAASKGQRDAEDEPESDCEASASSTGIRTNSAFISFLCEDAAAATLVPEPPPSSVFLGTVSVAG
ncbi:uncharacterized protein V6R79_011832 [Siganus canaliculatus]